MRGGYRELGEGHLDSDQTDDFVARGFEAGTEEEPGVRRGFVLVELEAEGEDFSGLHAEVEQVFGLVVEAAGAVVEVEREVLEDVLEEEGRRPTH